MQDQLSLAVGEAHVLERHVAPHLGESDRAARVLVLGPLAQDLPRPLQPGEGLRQLRPDGRDLEERPHEEAQEDGVGEERADRHAAGQDLARPRVHHARAHEPEKDGRGEGERRGRRQRAEHVVEDATDPALEYGRLAPLRVVPLHHPDAPERLRGAGR